MWLSLLSRFWPYLAVVALVIGSGWYLHHAGYESGYAASEARWQARFAVAERERDAANARAEKMESDSRDASAQSEKTNAENQASIALRADAAERSNRRLVRDLAAARACRGTVPQAGGPAPVTDAASASDPIADRVASDLTELARRCASDSATLAELQHWVTEQRDILR